MATPDVTTAYCRRMAVLVFAIALLICPTVHEAAKDPAGAATNVCSSADSSISIQVDPKTKQAEFVCEKPTTYVWPQERDGVVGEYFMDQAVSAPTGLVGDFGEGSQLEVQKKGEESVPPTPVTARLTVAMLPDLQRTIYFACSTKAYQAGQSEGLPPNTDDLHSEQENSNSEGSHKPGGVVGLGGEGQGPDHIPDHETEETGDRGETEEALKPVTPSSPSNGGVGAADAPRHSENDAGGLEEVVKKNTVVTGVSPQSPGASEAPSLGSGTPPSAPEAHSAGGVGLEITRPDQADQNAVVQKDQGEDTPKEAREGSRLRRLAGRSDNTKCIVAVTVPADPSALTCTTEKRTMELDVNDQTKSVDFKCDTNISSLSPPNSATTVYDGSCEKELSLEKVLPTAKVESTDSGYTFRVDQLPPTSTTVCYKCSAPSEHAERTEGAAACTIKIRIANAFSSGAATKESWPALALGATLIGFGVYTVA
ncbi:hypothetical protein BESB_079270 [Besnoitia besnoiti]|uniref:SRS domain-containing protein n=1 Tax=Besnoitia besnoiti TaxID=94643 RepID=A0A2A9MBL7_BESBE|nr:hypothetical protein BESB_079270 [Besnoitia besnoiti]PFH33711.1 hypothetical protein BESB_079270 [Besnoitia besnoiti]